MKPDLVSMLGLNLPRNHDPVRRLSDSENTLRWLDAALTAGLDIPSKWIVSACRNLEVDRTAVRLAAQAG